MDPDQLLRAFVAYGNCLPGCAAQRTLNRASCDCGFSALCRLLPEGVYNEGRELRVKLNRDQGRKRYGG